LKAIEINTIIRSVSSEVVQPEASFEHLITDSRRAGDVADCLFFAIPTKRNTGCRYVEDLFRRGCRNFVVPAAAAADYGALFSRCRGANFWHVKEVVAALQQLAGWRRLQYDIPVVGITGSNGKTIVKDWIVQLLSDSLRVVSSPRSYNSQIGVPLSVWQIDGTHQLGVFEAGISEAGEMERLREVINPTVGIFTNIGQAHEENFLTRYQKVAEKLQLFTRCDVLIYCTDHKEIHSAVSEKESFRGKRLFTWGTGEGNAVRLCSVAVEERRTRLAVECGGRRADIEIPFVDRASAENAMHCIALLFFLGYGADDIARRCRRLTPVAMRLELNEAVNNCLLVNDSYSLDLNSLSIALDYVRHERSHFKKTLIMSDILQAGMPEAELYAQASALIRQCGISRFIGIGEALCRNQSLFEGLGAAFFADTETFLRRHNFDTFASETILLKGARRFRFEDVAKMLQRKSHQTIMEVNLDNLVSNLNYYRSRIRPTTKLMAMVKAASYGAGKVEVASALQYNHADYLTVAYSDEGVDLRRNGITLPIMVMNPEEESFDDIIRYRLEPDIYSFRVFDSFSEAVRLIGEAGSKVPVHVEVDTGMHRLGFGCDDLDELCRRFGAEGCRLQVKSVFSHLACSEDPAMDDFTRLQIDRFRRWSGRLKAGLAGTLSAENPSIDCHILNSSGITRFPEAQMDMVRLGIGLYGISPEPEVQSRLRPVSRLKTRISQLKRVPAGDSVGYNRRWVAERDSVIAIISIGYADGLSRHLGCGNGSVMVGGARVPIIGSICMDMCFLDVTGVDCHEGDEVVLFGDARLLQQMSESAGTIPYEILTSVSPRVKRVYYQE